MLVRPPVNFAKSPSKIRAHAPRFGEHGVQLLREIGYAESTIGDLVRSGALIADEEPGREAGD